MSGRSPTKGAPTRSPRELRYLEYREGFLKRHPGTPDATVRDQFDAHYPSSEKIAEDRALRETTAAESAKAEKLDVREIGGDAYMREMFDRTARPLSSYLGVGISGTIPEIPDWVHDALDIPEEAHAGMDNPAPETKDAGPFGYGTFDAQGTEIKVVKIGTHYFDKHGSIVAVEFGGVVIDRYGRASKSIEVPGTNVQIWGAADIRQINGQAIRGVALGLYYAEITRRAISLVKRTPGYLKSIGE